MNGFEENGLTKNHSCLCKNDFYFIIMRRLEFTPHPRQQIFCKAAVAILAAVSVLLLQALDLFQAVELAVLDELFRRRGEREPNAAIVLVEIDEVSVETLGWPPTRDFYATLISALQTFGAKVIAFDLLLDEPRDAEDDEFLAAATFEAGNVIHAAYLAITDSASANSTLVDSSLMRFGLKLAPPAFFSFYPAAAATFPFPELLQASRQIGHLSVVPDPDRHVRKLPLLIEYQHALFPALSLSVVQNFLELPDSSIELGVASRRLILKKPPFGDLAVPINRQAEVLLNFYGADTVFKQRYSLLEVLQTFKAHERSEQGSLPAGAFTNKIALVGNTVAGDFDSFSTPFDAVLPGIMLHATAVSNLLDGNFTIPLSSAANFTITAALIFYIAFFPIILYILSEFIRRRPGVRHDGRFQESPGRELAMLRHFRIFNRLDLALSFGHFFILLLVVNGAGHLLFSHFQIWPRLLQINAGIFIAFAVVLISDFAVAINERGQIEKRLDEKSSSAVEAALVRQPVAASILYLRILIFMLDFRDDYLLVHSIYRSREDTELFRSFHPGRQEIEPFPVSRGLITKLREEQKQLWECYADYMYNGARSVQATPLDLLKRIGQAIYQDLGLCRTFDKIFAASQSGNLYVEFVIDLDVPWQWAYDKERNLFLFEAANCCTNFAIERMT
jgi:CHASE2 domain-containing sensor protein